MCDTQQLPISLPSPTYDLGRRQPLSSSHRALPDDSRMHIHVSLPDSHHYLSPRSSPHPDAMQVNPNTGNITCSSAPSAAVAYTAADLAPYSTVCCLSGCLAACLPGCLAARPGHMTLDSVTYETTQVSSFSYPTTPDPSLLTPVSSAGSPPNPAARSQVDASVRVPSSPRRRRPPRPSAHSTCPASPRPR